MDIDKIVDTEDILFTETFELEPNTGLKLGNVDKKGFTFFQMNVNGAVSQLDNFYDIINLYKESFIKFSDLELENKEKFITKNMDNFNQKELIDLVL